MINERIFGAKNKVPRQYPWLAQNESCDVLILGGGISGCLAAYKLAKAGVDVLVITKHPIGFGAFPCDISSSCSVGDMMLSDLSLATGRDNAVSCFARMESALDELEEISEELGDFGFARRDSFIYTDSANGINPLHSEYLMRHHNGFNATFMEQTDAREMFSFPIKAGILMKDAACELDNYKLCHELIAKAVELGARVYENTAAFDLLEQRRGIVAKTELGFTIQAKKLLLAIGAKQNKYLNFSPNKKRVFYVATSPIQNFSGYETRAIIKNVTTDVSVRTTSDDRIVVSGLSSSSFDNDSKALRLIGGERLANRKYSELSNTLETMLCGAGPLNGEHCYNGVYTTTKDMLPIIGKPKEYSNVYFNSPCSLNGILFSLIGAEVIKELHLNDTIDLLFSPDRSGI